MAQSVEQLIRNQQAAGSNPATSSKKTSEVLVFFYAVVGGLGLCPVPQARTGFPPLTLALIMSALSLRITPIKKTTEFCLSFFLYNS